MQDGIQDGGLWGPNYLVDSVKKRDNATERICERYGVKIKSRAIVMKKSSEEEAADMQKPHRSQGPIDECIDNGLENEENSKLLLLEAANTFG